jgi:ADP-heptose:LPS heptosyltransferase
MVDRHALVTQRIEFPRDRWKQARWSPATWREQIQKYTRLRQLRFDLGFDLQGHSKTALCLRLAAPSRRIGAHATDGFAGRLNPIAGAIPRGTHTIDWNHEVLNRLDAIPACARPRLPDVAAQPEENLVTISVSAGAAEKVYPLGHWEQIATRLISDGFRVVFLGGRPDPHPSVGEDLVFLATMLWAASL